MEFPLTFGLQKAGLTLILTSGTTNNLCFLIDTGATHNTLFDFVYEHFKSEFKLLEGAYRTMAVSYTHLLGIKLKHSGYFAMIPSNFDIDTHLDQHPVTDYLFVRDNTGHISSVTQEGSLISSQYFDKDRLIYIIAVSYTHLDVYKRQGKKNCAGR